MLHVRARAGSHAVRCRSGKQLQIPTRPDPTFFLACGRLLRRGVDVRVGNGSRCSALQAISLSLTSFQGLQEGLDCLQSLASLSNGLLCEAAGIWIHAAEVEIETERETKTEAGRVR